MVGSPREGGDIQGREKEGRSLKFFLFWMSFVNGAIKLVCNRIFIEQCQFLFLNETIISFYRYLDVPHLI